MAIKLARNGTRIAVMSNDALNKALQNVRPRKRRFIMQELDRRQLTTKCTQEVKESNQSSVA